MLEAEQLVEHGQEGRLHDQLLRVLPNGTEEEADQVDSAHEEV